MDWNSWLPGVALIVVGLTVYVIGYIIGRSVRLPRMEVGVGRSIGPPIVSGRFRSGK